MICYLKLIQGICIFLQSQSECPENVNCDCYCIQDDCFNQRFEIYFDNCELTVPVETIENETYSLHITAVNRALINTSIIKEVSVEQCKKLEKGKFCSRH